MVKVVDRYELKVLFKDEPSNLDTKYGVAVIIALHTIMSANAR